MAKKDFNDLVLAKGEVVLKNCDYLNVESGDYLQKSTLLLTNKRFIHRSLSKNKKMKKIDMDEVNINDIDSLDYNFTQAKKRLHPLIIILFILLFVGGIVLYVMLKKYITFLLSLLGIVILLLGIFLRKKTSAFNIDVISYSKSFDYLSLDEQKELNRTKKKKAILPTIIITIVFGGLIAGSYFFSDRLPINPKYFYYIWGGIALVYLLLLSMIIRSTSKKNKKVVKVDIPTDTKKKGKDNVSVEINMDGILDLINNMGALILDNKR